MRQCDKCPLSWEERGLEDCDCGCYVSDDFDKNIWCFLPKFLGRLKVWLIKKKQDKYWKEMVEACNCDLYSYGNQDTPDPDFYSHLQNMQIEAEELLETAIGESEIQYRKGYLQAVQLMVAYVECRMYLEGVDVDETDFI